MTVEALQSPLPFFPDLSGDPLQGGYIYFGQANQDPEQDPVTVYWDQAMTLVASQPLRTTAGYISRNGAPATVWVDGNCSIRVRDSVNRQVFYEADWAGFVTSAAAAAVAAGAEYVADAQEAATEASDSAAAAASAAATTGVYPSTASANVPRGLTQASVGAITAGAGGTNGTFALAWAGGNFSINPTGTFTVAGGALTAVTITGPGLYIGSSPTVPTPSFAASAGLAGAAVALTAQFLVTSGQGYWVQSQTGLTLDRYKNNSGVAAADAAVASVPTSNLVGANIRWAFSQQRLNAQSSTNRQRLTADAGLFANTLSDSVTNSGDSIARGFGATTPATGSASAIAARYYTATTNNIAADGARTDAIRTTFAALAAGQQNDYGITDGGTNDIVAFSFGLSGVSSITITAAGAGGTPGTYALAFAGGAGTSPTTPVGTFTVDGTGGVVSTSITNPGGGYSTAPTISTAACPGLAGATLTSVMDVPQTIYQNLSAVAAYSTNRLLMGPWTATTMSIQARRACALLKATYGGRFFDGLAFMVRQHSDTPTDIASAIKGILPPTLSGDGTHPNDAGYAIMGAEWALMIRAAAAVGAPYIHDDVAAAPITSGAAVWTPRVLGTPYRYSIVDGNEDGAYEISPTTGAITRSTSTTMPNVAELFVQAESALGPSNIARVVVPRKEVSTTPTRGVRLLTGGGRMGAERLTGGAGGKKMSIVLCARVNDAAGSGNYILRTSTRAGKAAYLQKTGTQFRPLAINDVGALVLTGASAPSPADTSIYNFYFFCVDTTGGVQLSKSITNEAFGGVQSATPTADAILDFQEIVYLFDGITNLDVKMLWIAQDYVDFTNGANRALFYDTTTFAPKDMGADGTMGGVTPIIFFQGYSGDYMTGNNRGNGGVFYAPPHVNRGNMAFVDLES